MSLRQLNAPLKTAILCGRGNNTTGGGSGGGNVSSKVTSPSALRQKYQSELDKVLCPENVPGALWKTLSAQYNESQLRAIKMVCNRTPNQESTISLLQGPPGTGKTKTILAVVSVFLAGECGINLIVLYIQLIPPPPLPI
jgi:primosomal protein N'